MPGQDSPSYTNGVQDIEKIAPKRGVIQQSVKDVVQALVDDNDLHQEKIGSSNFFWAFPGERAAKATLRTDAAAVSCIAPCLKLVRLMGRCAQTLRRASSLQMTSPSSTQPC